MPVAICPQCCRDYYLPAGGEDEARCEKCACPLVWIDELRADAPVQDTRLQGDNGPPPD
jgi:hypothetical protein